MFQSQRISDQFEWDSDRKDKREVHQGYYRQHLDGSDHAGKG